MIENVLMTAFWLLFAHALGDFSLTSRWIQDNKHQYILLMLVHCIIWTGCISFFLTIMSMIAAWKIAFLFFGHFLIDEWKCKKLSKIESNSSLPNWVKVKETKSLVNKDQLLHLVQLVVVGLTS